MPTLSKRTVAGGADVVVPGWSAHGADAPWLDSCDNHRNEGAGGGSRTNASVETSATGRQPLAAASVAACRHPCELPDSCACHRNPAHPSPWVQEMPFRLDTAFAASAKRRRHASITPLCPAGHLPHRWGDRLGGAARSNLNVLRKPQSASISPLVGEMPGRAEGGATHAGPSISTQQIPPAKLSATPRPAT